MLQQKSEEGSERRFSAFGQFPVIRNHRVGFREEARRGDFTQRNAEESNKVEDCADMHVVSALLKKGNVLGGVRLAEAFAHFMSQLFLRQFFLQPETPEIFSGFLFVKLILRGVPICTNLKMGHLKRTRFSSFFHAKMKRYGIEIEFLIIEAYNIRFEQE
ncbi:MAG: hypothetical protein IJK52_09270, partial [Oscillospiraceae bacterium]|nr:hypothetical protein [Oscillospiraceae bacterium]